MGKLRSSSGAAHLRGSWGMFYPPDSPCLAWKGAEAPGNAPFGYERGVEKPAGVPDIKLRCWRVQEGSFAGVSSVGAMDGSRFLAPCAKNTGVARGGSDTCWRARVGAGARQQPGPWGKASRDPAGGRMVGAAPREVCVLLLWVGSSWWSSGACSAPGGAAPPQVPRALSFAPAASSACH